MCLDRWNPMWAGFLRFHIPGLFSDSSLSGGEKLEIILETWNDEVVMHLHACLPSGSDSHTQETVNQVSGLSRIALSPSHRLSAPSAGHNCESQGVSWKRSTAMIGVQAWRRKMVINWSYCDSNVQVCTVALMLVCKKVLAPFCLVQLGCRPKKKAKVRLRLNLPVSPVCEISANHTVCLGSHKPGYSIKFDVCRLCNEKTYWIVGLWSQGWNTTIFEPLSQCELRPPFWIRDQRSHHVCLVIFCPGQPKITVYPRP